MSLSSPISNSSTFRWLSELISYFMRILARLKGDYYEFFIPPLLLSSPLFATLLTRLAQYIRTSTVMTAMMNSNRCKHCPTATNISSLARENEEGKKAHFRAHLLWSIRESRERPQINSTEHTLRARCCFTLFTKRAQRDKQVLSRTRTSPAWFLEFDRKNQFSFWFFSFASLASYMCIFLSWLFFCVVSFSSFLSLVFWNCFIFYCFHMVWMVQHNTQQRGHTKEEETTEKESERKGGEKSFITRRDLHKIVKTHSCLSGQNVGNFCLDSFSSRYRQNLIVACRSEKKDRQQNLGNRRQCVEFVYVFFCDFSFYPDLIRRLCNWFDKLLI